MDSVFLHTIINGIRGYAIQPFLNIQDLIRLLPVISLNTKKIALVDLGPSPMIVLLIQILVLLGIEVVYIDHHESNDKENELENYQKIFSLLGRNARILPGENAPAATNMVDIGEWLKGYDLVLFHDDLDGYFGFLKGCFEKKVFSQIDYDAEKFEGWGNSKPYSLLADLYLKAISCGPSFVVDSLSRQSNHQKLYDMLKIFIDSNFEYSPKLEKYIFCIEKEYEAIVSLTQKLLQEIKEEKGIVFVDCSDIYAMGLKPHLGTLKAEMFKKSNNEKVIAIRLIGKWGDQISMFTPRKFKKNFKLHQILPYEEKQDWHREGRLHIPYEYWENYKKKIQQFY